MATVRNKYDMWPLSNLELINIKDISGYILKKIQLFLHEVLCLFFLVPEIQLFLFILKED